MPDCPPGLREGRTRTCNSNGEWVEGWTDLNEFPCNQAVPPFAPPMPPAGSKLFLFAYWVGRGIADGLCRLHAVGGKCCHEPAAPTE